MGLKVFSVGSDVICLKSCGDEAYQREVASKVIPLGMSPLMVGMEFVKYDVDTLLKNEQFTKLTESEKLFERVISASEVPEIIRLKFADDYGIPFEAAEDEIVYGYYEFGSITVASKFKIHADNLVLTLYKHKVGASYQTIFPLLLISSLKEAQNKFPQIKYIFIQADSDEYSGMVKIFGEPEEGTEFEVYGIKLRNLCYREECISKLESITVSVPDNIGKDIEEVFELTDDVGDLKLISRFIGRWSYASGRTQQLFLNQVKKIAENGHHSVKELVNFACFKSGFYGEAVGSSMNFESEEARAIEEAGASDIKADSIKISTEDIHFGLVDIHTPLGKDILFPIFRECALLRNYVVFGAFTSDNRLIGYSLVGIDRSRDVAGLHLVYVSTPYRGQGIGSYILKSTLGMLDNEEMKYIFVKGMGDESRCDEMERFLAKARSELVAFKGNLVSFSLSELKKSVFGQKVMASADKLPKTTIYEGDLDVSKEELQMARSIVLPEEIFDSRLTSFRINNGELTGALLAAQISPKLMFIRDYFVQGEGEDFVLPALLSRTLSEAEKWMPEDSEVAFQIFDQKQFEGICGLVGGKFKCMVSDILIPGYEAFQVSGLLLEKMPVVYEYDPEYIIRDFLNSIRDHKDKGQPKEMFELMSHPIMSAPGHKTEVCIREGGYYV